MNQLIYFAASPKEHALIKIGISRKPDARIAGLSAGCPFPVKIIAQIPGTYAVEKNLHRKFSEIRVRGEWFRTDKLLMSFISTTVKVGKFSPDLFEAPKRLPIRSRRDNRLSAHVDSEIIEALGGTFKVANALSLDPRVISNWRKRGISAAGRYQISALAKRRRVALPDNFIAGRKK